MGSEAMANTAFRSSRGVPPVTRENAAPNLGGPVFAVWSPDSRTIYFKAPYADGRSSFRTIPAEGGRPPIGWAGGSPVITTRQRFQHKPVTTRAPLGPRFAARSGNCRLARDRESPISKLAAGASLPEHRLKTPASGTRIASSKFRTQTGPEAAAATEGWCVFVARCDLSREAGEGRRSRAGGGRQRLSEGDSARPISFGFPMRNSQT